MLASECTNAPLNREPFVGESVRITFIDEQRTLAVQLDCMSPENIDDQVVSVPVLLQLLVEIFTDHFSVLAVVFID